MQNGIYLNPPPLAAGDRAFHLMPIKIARLRVGGFRRMNHKSHFENGSSIAKERVGVKKKKGIKQDQRKINPKFFIELLLLF